MAEIVRMPKMSDTMTEGVVSKWHKKVGDKIKSGDLVADIETDKATMEFESYHDGVLLYIGVEQGKAAPVNGILAIVGKAGEDFSKLLEEEKKSQESKVKNQDSSVKTQVEVKKEIIQQKVTEPSTAKSVSSNNQPFTGSDERAKVSPLAKRLANEKGIDLSRISGTGDGGRIVKRDIDWYKPMPLSSSFTQKVISQESFEDVAVSQMRKTIAKRLAESKFTAPHFYLTMEINMDQAIQARESINAVASVKISFNDMIVKACASSLRQNPKVNSSWYGDFIRYNHHIHVGVAVAVEDGLLVPVIRFADNKTLTEISAETKMFSQKAKDKKLQPIDWEGNTFTISNLGMFGIEEFTAIINPPDACILAVGGIKETAVMKNGIIQSGNIMKLTLSCDHRVVDGVTGARFLQTLKYLLENPVVLLGAKEI